MMAGRRHHCLHNRVMSEGVPTARSSSLRRHVSANTVTARSRRCPLKGPFFYSTGFARGIRSGEDTFDVFADASGVEEVKVSEPGFDVKRILAVSVAEQS